ncbi:hypothetical protein [Microbacterium sp. C7(2022)]|uniref:hypothetical protein n=1 Tax=Microbacterium sp. C7(2022) TaxID=2992759 RepID=UPI00237B9465|nr:hypothetical protein [Microbacterium sp. C7(2022)]MDE0545414.1 hypothetical protein [Microbacterium sp. C7(2022)]
MPHLTGTWNISVATPMGAQAFVLRLAEEGATIIGEARRGETTLPVKQGRTDGNRGTFALNLSSPFPVTLNFAVTAQGDTLSGEAMAGMLGTFIVTGTRLAA